MHSINLTQFKDDDDEVITTLIAPFARSIVDPNVNTDFPRDKVDHAA